MSFVQGLRCVLCGTVHGTRVANTCPRCGIDGILDVEYNFRAIADAWKARPWVAREFTAWRYRELLPIGAESELPALSVGGTPLTETAALARYLGAGTLFLKDEGRNATASLKDRASAIGVVRAHEKPESTIACASTGNAASSCAGLAASMGLRSVIFVPERAPEPKITQLLIFGATVLRVRGSYEDAFRLSQQSCERWGWYNRNSGINPYLVEGKKTAGLEIAEQLQWQPPDWVAVSVGDGCTIAGIGKAFRELKLLGLIPRMPRLLGVQAEGAAPVTAAFRSGDALRTIEPRTVADSIAVGVPRNWRKAIREVSGSHGAMINVSDEEILDAIRYTGRLAGIFAEPAAAAAVAGVRRALAEEVIPKSATVVAVVTGNGLKDVAAAHRAAGQPFDLPRDGAGLEEILRERKLVA